MRPDSHATGNAGEAHTHTGIIRRSPDENRSRVEVVTPAFGGCTLAATLGKPTRLILGPLEARRNVQTDHGHRENVPSVAYFPLSSENQWLYLAGMQMFQ